MPSIHFHKASPCVPLFKVEPLSVKHQYKGKFTTDMQQLSLLTVPVGPDLPPQVVIASATNSVLAAVK